MKKRLFISIFVVYSVVFLHSQDVNSQLDSIKQYYLNGDLDKALQTLDILKGQISNEKSSKKTVDYISLINWNIVVKNPEDYIGKKVKLPAIFNKLNSDGTVILLNISDTCTFDKKLSNDFAALKSFSSYTFYGTVFIANDGPSLNIERLSQ